MTAHRKVTIYSSDSGTTEISYSTMPDAEIHRRIAEYEKRYGMPLKRYIRSFSCDHAGHQEVFDQRDWETLTEERDNRSAVSRTA
jgi:hypothetical protein